MGAVFKIEHVNFIAYLTGESDRTAPHADSFELRMFLDSLAGYGMQRVDEVVAFSPQTATSHTTGRDDVLISSHPEWIEEIGSTARQLVEQHFWTGGIPDILEPDRVAAVLSPLRRFFSGYLLYAMVISRESWGAEDQEVTDFFRYAAIETGGQGLILKPVGTGDFLDVVDPFPALRILADAPAAPPTVAFWTSLGGACVLPLREAEIFLRRDLLGAIDHGIRSLDTLLRRRSSAIVTKRILQMSDLHFGKPEAARRRRYLKDHLSEILTSIDRVVITGDLFDSPEQAFKSEFDDFRLDVEEMTKGEVIVIPGNHDVRFKGNSYVGLGNDFRQLAGLRWNPVVCDKSLKAIFFCFNSAEGGNYARGHVSEEQRLDRAAEFSRLRRESPEVSDYLKIALVHHHPYAYGKGTPATTLYDRLIRLFFKNEDEFLAFENAEDFIDWCEARGVSLVLHGHKHTPRRTLAKNDMLVVGCGSTTGAEHTPMSYNVVTYDPRTTRWSASFFHDPKADGSGFKLLNVTIDRRS